MTFSYHVQASIGKKIRDLRSFGCSREWTPVTQQGSVYVPVFTYTGKQTEWRLKSADKTGTIST